MTSWDARQQARATLRETLTKPVPSKAERQAEARRREQHNGGNHRLCAVTVTRTRRDGRKTPPYSAWDPRTKRWVRGWHSGENLPEPVTVCIRQR